MYLLREFREDNLQGSGLPSNQGWEIELGSSHLVAKYLYPLNYLAAQRFCFNTHFEKVIPTQ